KPVDVGTSICLGSSGYHLGRHVRGRAGDRALLGQIPVGFLAIGGLHQSEVEDLGEVLVPATMACVQVGGLDVAMNESRGVSFRQRVTGLSQEVHGSL